MPGMRLEPNSLGMRLEPNSLGVRLEPNSLGMKLEPNSLGMRLEPNSLGMRLDRLHVSHYYIASFWSYLKNFLLTCHCMGQHSSAHLCTIAHTLIPHTITPSHPHSVTEPISETILEPLIHLLQSSDVDVQKASSLALSNFALHGPSTYVKWLDDWSFQISIQIYICTCMCMYVYMHQTWKVICARSPRPAWYFRIPFKWLEFVFECFKSCWNGWNSHSSVSNLHWNCLNFRMIQTCLNGWNSHSSGSNLQLNVSNPIRMVRICIRVVRICIRMLEIPFECLELVFEWFKFAFQCFESCSNCWHSLQVVQK